jgi:hypothetical protein
VARVHATGLSNLVLTAEMDETTGRRRSRRMILAVPTWQAGAVPTRVELMRYRERAVADARESVARLVTELFDEIIGVAPDGNEYARMVMRETTRDAIAGGVNLSHTVRFPGRPFDAANLERERLRRVLNATRNVEHEALVARMRADDARRAMEASSNAEYRELLEAVMAEDRRRVDAQYANMELESRARHAEQMAEPAQESVAADGGGVMGMFLRESAADGGATGENNE